MSLLTSLKAAAQTDLSKAETTVKTYVATLESKVAANKAWVIGGGAAGTLIGGLLTHFLKL
jgi:glycerate kinase